MAKVRKTSLFDKKRTREFDSCIIRKVLAGRVKPVFFLSSFSFYYLVIFSDVWYNYYRGDCYACYYI